MLFYPKIPRSVTPWDRLQATLIAVEMLFTILSSYLALSILFTIRPTSGSPLTTPLTNQSSSSGVDLAVTRPPKPPICPEDLGPKPPRTTFFASDCEKAVAMIPRDIRPASPLRNFYLLAEHVDPAMSNVLLPFEVESGMFVNFLYYLHILCSSEEQLVTLRTSQRLPK